MDAVDGLRLLHCDPTICLIPPCFALVKSAYGGDVRAGEIKLWVAAGRHEVYSLSVHKECWL